MKKSIKRATNILLCAVLIVSVTMIACEQAGYGKNSSETDAIKEVAGISRDKSEKTETVMSSFAYQAAEQARKPKTLEEELASIDFDSLKAVNSDIIGWICVPNTDISYPILKSKDNGYYLRRNWRCTHNVCGSIFADYKNASDFSDFNTVLYGHRMRNGTMFAELAGYESQDFYDSHKYFYVALPGGKVNKYLVYAAWNADESNYPYVFSFPTGETRDTYIKMGIKNSIINAGIVPSASDSLITLSTCSKSGGYSKRWVVQGVFQKQFVLDKSTKI